VNIKPDEYQKLRIVVGSNLVQCYLDGQLIHEHAYGVIPYLTSVTTLDETNNELIVKLVNPSAFVIHTELDIRGTNITKIAGEQLLLTADEPDATNTMEQPNHVVPTSFPLHLDSRMYPVPAHSVVILKIKLG
jgi:alpha-N-arabinofuranosidase